MRQNVRKPILINHLLSNEAYDDIERIDNDDPKLAERWEKSMINDFNNGTLPGPIGISFRPGQNQLVIFVSSSWKYRK
jgi:hypothetical protein